MKITLSYMKFSATSDHHEIITEVIEADKIILDTTAKRFEIGLKKADLKKAFGYPNQFIRCLLITEKNGVKKLHGYFTKIDMYLDGNENFLGIISIEEVFAKEDIDKYFKKEYQNVKSAEKVDVQTISIDDFLIQSKIVLMKEARTLFKRRKNVK